MAEFVSVYCQHCKQTFLTVEDAVHRQKCDLCGKTGGIGTHSQSPTEPSAEAIVPPTPSIPTRNIGWRHYLFGFFAILLANGIWGIIMAPGPPGSTTGIVQFALLIVGLIGFVMSWPGTRQGDDQPARKGPPDREE